uniref:Uncharacterized protein n=1 Tax=Chloropicon laureae TaxID=464258 RepID=A0A7S2Z7V4_9CHLO
MGRRRGGGALRRSASLLPLVLLLALSLLAVCSAHFPKEVDPSDPSLLSVKDWFEEELDKKYNSTNEIVHFCDAQKQVVNGFNYMVAALVKTEYHENETSEWMLHSFKVFEHPAWEQAPEKYEMTFDEAPVFEDADLALPAKVSTYVTNQLREAHTRDGAGDALAVTLAEVVEHYEQELEVEKFSASDKPSATTLKTVAELVSHRVYGRFVIGKEKHDIDVVFVTMNGDFIYFDYADFGVSEDSGSGGAGTGPKPDVKLLTMKTSALGIFLVGLVVCGIFMVHFYRKKHKKSKEDWYIEQLTDIDEL